MIIVETTQNPTEHNLSNENTKLKAKRLLDEECPMRLKTDISSYSLETLARVRVGSCQLRGGWVQCRKRESVRETERESR